MGWTPFEEAQLIVEESHESPGGRREVERWKRGTCTVRHGKRSPSQWSSGKVMSVSRGQEYSGCKSHFAGKVRLYLEIRVLERLSVSMFPFGDTEETELKSKMLKSSKKMDNCPVARRCLICIICRGLRIGRPCAESAF